MKFRPRPYQAGRPCYVILPDRRESASGSHPRAVVILTADDGGDEWLELAAETEPEAVESVSAVFAEYGQGVAIEQVVESSRDGDVVNLPADAPMIVKTYLPVADPSTPERRAHIEKAVWALGKLRKVGPLQVRTLREADWANAWKQYFFVHRVGRRHGHRAKLAGGRVRAAARTTRCCCWIRAWPSARGCARRRMCLRALGDLPVKPGMRVLDVGAGSGILAIAAARLGASYVEAVEIDPVAASVCQQNVERNRVGDVVSVRLGTLQGEPDEPFDVVLANISIATLLDLHPLLAVQLRPGGLAVLSGVLAERADELWETLRAAGLATRTHRFRAGLGGAAGQTRVKQHRFCVSADQLRGDLVSFSAEQWHQLHAVLRLRPGDTVRVFDGVNRWRPSRRDRPGGGGG